MLTAAAGLAFVGSLGGAVGAIIGGIIGCGVGWMTGWRAYQHQQAVVSGNAVKPTKKSENLNKPLAA
jgi:uncharacterized protein YcfJ